MSTQDPLFHEDFRDALRHIVKAMGGVEAVGSELWPAKTRKAAGTWLSDCLNPERPAKLDLEEVVELLRMGRIAQVHCAMDQLASEAGYAKPDIAPTKTPRQELAEKMQRLAAEYAKLADEDAALDRDDLAADLRQHRRGL